jgi:hypothetical protein
MMISDIPKLLKETCDLVRVLSNRPALRTGTDEGARLRELLYSLSEDLVSEIERDGVAPKIFVSVGSGNGYIPRVPWVFFSSEPGRVSSKIGVAVCFGRTGNGIVVGVMPPAGTLTDRCTFRRIGKRDDMKINVDGDSSITRYNNRFIGPTEIFLEDFKKLDLAKIVISKINELKLLRR